MGFAFEELKVYQRAIDFATEVIDAVEQMATPNKHFRLVEQLEAASTSVALNIAEGKADFPKKNFGPITKNKAHSSLWYIFSHIRAIEIHL